ncbi:hypothetical protein Bbelb_390600 [Branchiostoma belcheri]|nr:hypothetical protein Bbelb_413000 [Branchiostoma belcheri]KAI8483178.1 hypothetical protein Bbelb_390600 [Branchiostoma belcheri]
MTAVFLSFVVASDAYLDRLSSMSRLSLLKKSSDLTDCQRRRQTPTESNNAPFVDLSHDALSRKAAGKVGEVSQFWGRAAAGPGPRSRCRTAVSHDKALFTGISDSRLSCLATSVRNEDTQTPGELPLMDVQSETTFRSSSSHRDSAKAPDVADFRH